MDFGFTPAHKKGNATMGRRAAVATEDEDLQEADDILSSSLDSPRKTIPPSAVANARRPGRWAASAQGGGFGPPQEDRRLRRFDDDDGQDIQVIPDLEEVVEEDFTQQIAQAPNIQVNRVATFKELDSDLLRHAAFSTLDDIDLKHLTTPLVPEAEIREADVEWKWDVLFTEISSELTAEWEENASEAKDSSA